MWSQEKLQLQLHHPWPHGGGTPGLFHFVAIKLDLPLEVRLLPSEPPNIPPHPRSSAGQQPGGRGTPAAVAEAFNSLHLHSGVAAIWAGSCATPALVGRLEMLRNLLHLNRIGSQA
ncbi:hypothetical protein AAFF_G00158390 [Aldrovandia affinis]|uniref:Uncharacterized protein n=1 Tax=Aldrovandia affinis TaxID=143900 RepID=A0AAD7W8G9_9TELE|nr:hypothetical protein AAFF_G00158390 [Aldrovandia affinis]